MAALGLEVYGSDDEEEVSLAVSAGGGVVLMGDYATAPIPDDAESAQQPAPLSADSAAAAAAAAAVEAMDVDVNGASPTGMKGSEAPSPGRPGSGAAEEVDSLPSELFRQPPGECDPILKAKVEKFLQVRKNDGREIKAELRHSRGYRNPDFLQKMVEYAQIQSSGSNFPKDVFNPDDLHPEDFFDALRVAWDKEQERRTAERAATGRIEFTGGSSKHSGALSGGQSRLPTLPGASGDVAAVVQKARLQAQAVAAKAKGSRWDHNK